MLGKHWLLGLLMVLSSFAGCAAEQTETAITVQEETLPTPRWGMGTVWTGSEVLLAGGWTGSKAKGTLAGEYDGILTYTPSTGTVEILDASLPTPRRSLGAIWAGSAAFLFGGNGQTIEMSDEVLRFDPTAETVTKEDTRLPFSLVRPGIVWTGDTAYLFGGIRGDRHDQSDRILRYTPADDSFKVMDARLPTPVSETAAVWDGRFAYVFGGANPSGAPVDTIVRYDPVSDEVETMDARLPTPRAGLSAVATDRFVYMFGGFVGDETDRSSKTDEILRFDLSEPSAVRMNATLPFARHLTDAVWTGDAAFIFGGNDENGESTSQIIKYVPSRDTVSS